MISAWKVLQKAALVIVFFLFFILGFSFWNGRKEINQTSQQASLPLDNGQFVLPDNLKIKGDLEVDGKVKLTDVYFESSDVDGKIVSVNEKGRLVFVPKWESTTTPVNTVNTSYVYSEGLPPGHLGELLYYTDEGWRGSVMLSQSNEGLGIGKTASEARLEIETGNKDREALIVKTTTDQVADIIRLMDASEHIMFKVNSQGKLVLDNSADHQLEIRPSGNTGWLSSSGGAIFIENSYNIGTGIGIYSNAGASAEGNMINIKVDNEDYQQAAFYMNYDGISNAVEIVSNTNDSSSNALSITNYNQLDSALGVIGYETNRGTVKVSHKKSGNDANASGISIDLQGTGTAAQGLYVDSTADGGTSGNLLRLRNETIDRFVVSSLGSLTLGTNGTNTFIKKVGNTVGDEFYVGTNSAFRVQRSATDSEAFRTQVVGDTQGRWLGTADGKLKFGDGISPQDVVMQRVSAGLMQLDGDFQLVSQEVNNDVFAVNASDGSLLMRLTETGGGASWLEMYDATGGSKIRLRGDNGNSYINSGNLSFGTTSVGTNANKVFALGNGEAPTSSIVDGVQLWAEDVGSLSELRVRDEAGTITTLSPHNFSLIPKGASEEMAWSFYAQKNDVAINVDMTRALRILEELSGEKIIYLKNLQNGSYIEPEDSLKAQNLKKAQLNPSQTDDVSQAVGEYLEASEFSKHVVLGEVWEFVGQVVHQARTIFNDSVEFLANVHFGGKIAVNADVANWRVIEPDEDEFSITFASAYDKKPLLYVNSSDTAVDFEVVEVTEEGFKVRIKTARENPVEFSWLVLTN